MRRVVLHEAGPAEDKRLVLEEAPTAHESPGQNEVLLRVLACGVCRTDLHIVEGEVAAALPRVPGHQAVGVVERVGAGVAGVSVGDRVGVGWLASTCGRCYPCQTGRENLCENATFTGRDVDGGYADTMPANADFVFPIPPSFSDIEAAPLLCAGIIGYRALKLSEVPRGGALGLWGFGASAHLALQVARGMGCDVYVFTREEGHRQLARELGAVWAGDIEDTPGVALHAGVGFAPAGSIVPVALARLARGGTFVMNAVHATDIPAFPFERIYWERTVRSVTNYTRQDAREFLSLAAEVPLRVETEMYGLDRANEALVRIKRGEVRGAAVLVACR